MNAQNGFDLGPVIGWVADNQKEIESRLSWLHARGVAAEKPSYVLRNSDHLLLSEFEIHAAIRQYPVPARQRSVLTVISGGRPKWFHKDSTAAKPIATGNVEEALCPTAIIPGYTDYPIWEAGKKEATTWLYELADVPLDIARIILTYTLLHEYCHTLVVELFYNQAYRLRMGTGQCEVSGLEFMTEFAEKATRHSPVSHYSSAYWPLSTDPEDPSFYTAVSEEICDTVASYLLGFMYSDQKERWFDPLNDRLVLASFAVMFLNATRTS